MQMEASEPSPEWEASGPAASGVAHTGEEAEVFPRKYLTLETCKFY